jgi:lipopolysaccharide heptosyltransferase III
MTRQAAPTDWSGVRRLLLIRLRSIGDTVLMTPCLDALKRWRADLKVSVLLEPLSVPVLEDHPLVDELIVAGEGLLARAQMVGGLRRRKFDIAFNLHGGTTGMILARLSGARHTFGFRGHRQSWMLTGRAPGPDVILGRDRVHSVEQQLSLLHWSGMPWPAARPKLHLVVSPEAEARVRERLYRLPENLSAGFAVIAPAAAFESKRWPATGFAAVADHLSDHWGMPSVVIAGPGQEHVAREVSACSAASPAVITGLSLKQLIALTSMSSFFAGNDSGPAHIAAALARPMVVVFGSSNPSVWSPWTDLPYRVIGGQGSGIGGRGSGVRDRGPETELLIESIPADDVIAGVDEVLKLALAADFKADTSFQATVIKQ